MRRDPSQPGPNEASQQSGAMRGEIAGYVLAGGASRRFGKDKALVELGGTPMLARMLQLTENGIGNKAATQSVFVVGAPEKYGKFAAPCIDDRWPGQGPLGGIVTALLHARENAHHRVWNLILSCDMPFLTSEWLSFLADRVLPSTAEVVFAHSESGPEPLCACWRTGAAETLLAAFERGMRKVTDGIALLSVEILDEKDWKRFDNQGRLFWNMNTEKDYEEARRIVEAQQ